MFWSPTQAPPLEPSRALPLKFRRKSITASDADPDELPQYLGSPPRAYSFSSSPPSSSYSSYSSAPSSSNLYLSSPSTSSSPIATSAVLGSTPGSPAVYAQARGHSSPLHDYRYGYSYEVRADAHHAARADYFFARAAYDKPREHLPLTATSRYSSLALPTHVYRASSEASEEPPMTSDVDVDGSEYQDHTDEDSDEDIPFGLTSPNAGYFTHPRRISFSTSAERDRPYVPRARRTSCPVADSALEPERQTKVYSMVERHPLSGVSVSRRSDPLSAHARLGAPRRTGTPADRRHNMRTEGLSASRSSVSPPIASSSPAMSESSDLPPSSPHAPESRASSKQPEPGMLPPSSSRSSLLSGCQSSQPPTPPVRHVSSLYALLNPMPEPDINRSQTMSALVWDWGKQDVEEVKPFIPESDGEDADADVPVTADAMECDVDVDILKVDEDAPHAYDDGSSRDVDADEDTVRVTRLSSPLIPLTPSRGPTPVDDLPPSSPSVSPVEPSICAHIRTLPPSPISSPLSSPPSSPRHISRGASEDLPDSDIEIDVLAQNDTIVNTHVKTSKRERGSEAGPSRSRSQSSVPEKPQKVRSEKRSRGATEGAREKKRVKVELREGAFAKLDVEVGIPRTAESSVPLKKRVKESANAPVRKRPRLILSDSESDEEDEVVAPKAAAKAHEGEKENKAAERRKDGPSSAKLAQKAAGAAVKQKGDGERVRSAPKASTSALVRASSERPSKQKRTAAHREEPEPPAAPSLDLLPLPLAEMQGMLIETLATSRASSMPPSTLYSAMIASRPSLKDIHSLQGEGVLSKREWLSAIEDVLEAGRRSTGVFGKVESTVKDMADHQLEAQWFYVPERDADQERATLIRSMMPRPAKRSETKKAKQYYWRPLGKISRWDPEDDL